jgi:hypothetical protein
MLEQELGHQKPKQNRGILSLNKMLEGIIKAMAQSPDGSPVEPKGVNAKWRNDCSVLAREKCKITCIDWGAVPVNEKETLRELIKPHYVFLSLHEERGKRVTILTIGGPSKVHTCTQQVLCSTWCFTVQSVWIYHTKRMEHLQRTDTTPESIACCNRMKALIQKNMFKHRLGPGGYKAAIPL